MTTITTPITLRCDLRSTTRGRVRASSVLLGCTFALVWLVSLSRSLFDPIGYDQALYQYITQRVMAGDRMYVDLWDQNAPGIVAIHWLSTGLVGGSPMALRAFDAGWQLLTLIALIGLAARDGRRWHVGWLAATLYALAYYGLGYVHTAQREGFAVLPLLLAVHATLPAGPATDRPPLLAARHFVGGVLGFLVFAIKPPLGLCFGVLWLLALRDAWGQRHRGRTAWSSLIGLSAGFILSTAASVALMMHLGWWEGFWPVLTRQDAPGYIRGPALVRDLAPYLLGAAAVIGVVSWLAHRGNHADTGERCPRWARVSAGSLVVVLLLLSLQRWPDWQQTFLRLAGLLAPAAGAMLIGPWRERSRVWQSSVLLAGACFVAIVWQGQFYLYHYPPLLAFAAYLAASELVDRFAVIGSANGSARLWTAVCLGCIAHLMVSTWGWTMTFYTRSPYVLAGTTLEDHYSRVTRHKTRFPTYATTARAARRVQDLTGPTDAIACLIDEPRLYYLSERPALYPLLRTQDCYRDQFPGLLRAIGERQPKVVLARVPHMWRETQEPLAANGAGVASAVFADLESYFGPPARVIRDLYRITEIIDSDVCILQPTD